MRVLFFGSLLFVVVLLLLLIFTLCLAMGFFIIIKQDIAAMPIQVFELVAFYRPEKHRYGDGNKHHGDGNHQVPDFDIVHKRDSLSELVITISELADMPTMANQGETWPMAASGNTTRL